MSNDEFQARIKRMNSKAQHLQSPRMQPNGPGRFSWAGTFKGFVLSLLIGFAFANIQVISDMAPQSIKDGPTPGIFGVPVAVISILWIIITPIWFFRAVMKGVQSDWTLSMAGFPLGLFAGLAVSLLMLRGVF